MTTMTPMTTTDTLADDLDKLQVVDEDPDTILVTLDVARELARCAVRMAGARLELEANKAMTMGYAHDAYWESDNAFCPIREEEEMEA